jgi:hypothetical protein
MDNLQQIVVQETTAPYKRALAQYGTGFIPETQVEVIYDDLSASEKVVYDAFVDMIKTKQAAQ